MKDTRPTRPKACDIRVGGFYVNEKKDAVRQVFDEPEPGRFHWRDYWLGSGQPTLFASVCSAETLARWAEREATPDEIERLNIEAGHLSHVARAQDLAAQLIKHIPDDMLLEEARRRGLQMST